MIKLPHDHTLEIHTEEVEVTRGIHGMPLEPVRRFAPGVTSYYLDGEPITEDEARTIIESIDGGDR